MCNYSIYIFPYFPYLSYYDLRSINIVSSSLKKKKCIFIVKKNGRKKFFSVWNIATYKRNERTFDEDREEWKPTPNYFLDYAPLEDEHVWPISELSRPPIKKTSLHLSGSILDEQAVDPKCCTRFVSVWWIGASSSTWSRHFTGKESVAIKKFCCPRENACATWER